MIKFINAVTGGEMWVADERAEEYKAAGHVPAVSAEKPKTPRKTVKKPVKK